LVISGEADKIEKACDLAKAKGARRAIPLPVAEVPATTPARHRADCEPCTSR